MLFPIGDENVKGGAKPIFAYSFIVVNIIVFLFQISLGSLEQINAFLSTYGAIPVEILKHEDLYTLISSIFLHGGLMHLLGNMLFLWIFADNIEATIGNLHFVIFYLAGGLIAALTHVYFSPLSNVPIVGASGAISAIMGAYMVLFTNSKIKMIFLIFFKKFEIPAYLFLGFWFVQQLFSVFKNTETTQSGVAWWAHIGGFIFGALYAYFLIKGKTKTDYNRA